MHYHTAYRQAVQKVCQRIRGLKKVSGFFWARDTVRSNPVLHKLKHSVLTANDLGYKTVLEVEDGNLHVRYTEHFKLSELNPIE